MEDLTLQDYFRPILRHRLLIIGVVAVAVVVALIATLMMPKVYRAQAKIFVSGPSGGIASTLGQIGLQLPVTSSSVDYVLAVLDSRTLAEAVAREVEFPPGVATAAARSANSPMTLEDKTGIIDDMRSIGERNGLVTIGAEGTDPAFSAAVANTFVKALGELLHRSATRRSRFVEQQLQNARVQLSEAEEAVRGFQEREGTVEITTETTGLIQASLNLQAAIASTNVEISQNANMLRESGSLTEIAQLQTVRAGLLAKRAQLQQQIRAQRAQMSRIPAVAVQFGRLKLNLELASKRYELLSEQLQLAAIAEQQEETSFQTIDVATTPRIPSSPRVRLNLAIGAVLGLLLGAGAAYWQESRVKSGRQFRKELR